MNTESLSLAEAARRANVSPTSVRRWITDGRLKASKNQSNQWSINPTTFHNMLIEQSLVPSGNGRAGASQGLRTVGETVGRTVGPDVGHMEALNLLKDGLQREQRISDELRQQNKELQGEVLKMAQEMKAILSGNTGNSLMRWVQNLKKS